MKNNQLRSVVLFWSGLTFAACSSPVIEGTWIQPVPGMPDKMQGVILKENGEANSVNMATLQYTGWKQEGKRLILSGNSIGNHQTIVFSDTLVISSLTQDSLILGRKDMGVVRYAREIK